MSILVTGSAGHLGEALVRSLRALERAADIRFSRYIVSATSPFVRDDLAMFGRDAPRVVRRIFPECGPLYAARGWKFFPQVDRLHVNDRARTELTAP